MTPEEMAQLAMYADTAGGPNPESINALGGGAPVQQMPTSQPGLPGVDPGALSRGVDYAESTSPYHPGPPEPNDPGFDTSMLPHPAPGVSNPDAAEPGMTDLPHPAPGQTRTSVSNSRTDRGFSSAKYDEVSGKPQSDLDRRLASQQAQATAQWAPVQDKYDQAAEQSVAAQKLETAREMDIIGVKAAQQFAESEFRNQYMAEEQNAVLKARADAETAKAQYRASLLSIPEVNSGQFFDNLGAAGTGAVILGAAFSGYLATRGIKTDFMENINGGIRDNIDAQIQNMNRGAKVAAGFKDLWEMTRTQSASDAEAREKMFGYGLASLKAKAQGELGKYESGLAFARGQQALAKITEAQAKNDFDIQTKIDASYNARAGQEVEMAKAKLSASLQYAQMAAAKSEAALNRKHELDKAKAKSEEVNPSDYIVDPTKTGGGAFRWKLRPGTDPETRRDVKNKVAATATATEALEELSQLQAKVDSAPNSLARTRFLNDLQAREQALRATVRNGIILEYSGKASTDKEYTRYVDELLSPKLWFQQHDNREKLYTLLTAKQEEEANLRAEWADPVSPSDQYANRRVPKEYVNEGARDAANLYLSENHGQPDMNSEVNRAITKISGVEGDVLATDASRGTAGDEFRDFIKKAPQVIKDEIANNDPRVGDTSYTVRHGMGADDAQAAQVNLTVPTQRFVSMRDLATLALNDPAAMAKLQEFAGGDDSPADVMGLQTKHADSDELQAYAQYYLDQLKSGTVTAPTDTSATDTTRAQLKSAGDSNPSLKSTADFYANKRRN